MQNLHFRCNKMSTNVIFYYYHVLIPPKVVQIVIYFCCYVVRALGGQMEGTWSHHHLISVKTVSSLSNSFRDLCMMYLISITYITSLTWRLIGKLYMICHKCQQLWRQEGKIIKIVLNESFCGQVSRDTLITRSDKL